MRFRTESQTVLALTLMIMVIAGPGNGALLGGLPRYVALKWRRLLTGNGRLAVAVLDGLEDQLQRVGGLGLVGVGVADRRSELRTQDDATRLRRLQELLGLGLADLESRRPPSLYLALNVVVLVSLKVALSKSYSRPLTGIYATSSVVARSGFAPARQSTTIEVERPR